MNLESIQEMWGRDSVIDDVMLDQASLKIPQLHSKYLTLLNEFKLLKKKTEQQHRKLTHNKWLYYSGKATPQVYEDEPFEYKVMKGDVPRWIEVDEQVNTLEMKPKPFPQNVTRWPGRSRRSVVVPGNSFSTA